MDLIGKYGKYVVYEESILKENPCENFQPLPKEELPRCDLSNVSIIKCMSAYCANCRPEKNPCKSCGFSQDEHSIQN